MLIAFEGTNACGKTTIMRETCAELEKLGYKIFQTKVPTRGEIGMMLRKYQSTQEYMEMSGAAIALLGAADKYENTDGIVSRKLKEGFIVVSDRFLLSSYIYNKMDGIDFDFTDKIYSKIQKPDVTIVLSLPPEQIKENLKCRPKRELDRYEKQFETEMTTFDEAIKHCEDIGHKLELVKITRDIAANVKKIIKLLQPYLKEKKTK